jgi:hypothetical protein
MSAVRRYAAPIARLTVFVAVVAAVLLYVDYRIARASVMDRLLGIGHRMAPFMDNMREMEAPRELHINGLRLWAAAGKTDQAPREVRRWYAERYAGKGTAMDVTTEAFKLAKLMPPTASGLTQAQFGDDSFGGMAALDLGQGLTMRQLRAAALKLAAGKLGEVGHLRYMYYERTSTGGTRYLTIWTDDTFDMTKFLPSGTEDAPGRDLEDVPRYPGTVRVLSADERGKPGQMVVYSSGTGSPDSAAMFYDARMRTLGWQSDPQFAKTAREQGLKSRRFLNGKGHEVVVDLSDADRGQGLTVTAIQLK